MRPLDSLSSEVFTKHALSVFADTLYIKPAKTSDIKIVCQTTAKDYGIDLSLELQETLLNLVDGYNQYLQFSLITIREQNVRTSEELLHVIQNDERIMLQSEELWESLNSSEQLALGEIIKSQEPSSSIMEKAEYLYKTGILTEKHKIFSPLFEKYIKDVIGAKQKDNHSPDFSKKEHALLTYLESHKNDICEREEIIEVVWKEAEALGVSDWAIDRLVARLRAKLKIQNSHYEIITVKTRGYKLIDSN